MSALYLLIVVSLLIALGFLIAYLWAVRHGQYDDTSTPALRVLLDEPPPTPPAPGGAGVPPATPSPSPGAGVSPAGPRQERVSLRQTTVSRQTRPTVDFRPWHDRQPL